MPSSPFFLNYLAVYILSSKHCLNINSLVPLTRYLFSFLPGTAFDFSPNQPQRAGEAPDLHFYQHPTPQTQLLWHPGWALPPGTLPTCPICPAPIPLYSQHSRCHPLWAGWGWRSAAGLEAVLQLLQRGGRTEHPAGSIHTGHKPTRELLLIWNYSPGLTEPHKSFDELQAVTGSRAGTSHAGCAG